MDDKTYLGSLAEAKVVAELTKQKYFVFNQVSGKAPFDLVAYKDNTIKRISVKGCTKKDKYNSFCVQIGKVRSNKTANVIHKFDSSSCDILAVYLLELDQVCFIESNKIVSGRQINIRTAVSKFSRQKESFIVSELLSVEGSIHGDN